MTIIEAYRTLIGQAEQVTALQEACAALPFSLERDRRFNELEDLFNRIIGNLEELDRYIETLGAGDAPQLPPNIAKFLESL